MPARLQERAQLRRPRLGDLRPQGLWARRSVRDGRLFEVELGVGALADEQLKHDDGERIEVHGVRVVLAPVVLGRHVAQGAHATRYIMPGVAFLAAPAAPLVGLGHGNLCVARIRLTLLQLQRREAKVRHLRHAVRPAQHDVARLQIAVDDGRRALVQKVHALGDVVRPPQTVRHGEGVGHFRRRVDHVLEAAVLGILQHERKLLVLGVVGVAKDGAANVADHVGV
mmetsp:Transcript_29010/g.85047  ORF Transcript_29010/g.85047 Transcript_29010/m.85047 type:complete len:226 (+) Transcript_29010:412-1089(+)